MLKKGTFCEFCGEKIETDDSVYSVLISYGFSRGQGSFRIDNPGYSDEDYDDLFHACGPDCVGFLWTFFSILSIEDFKNALKNHRELINAGKVTAGVNAFVAASTKLKKENSNAEKEETDLWAV